jgi:hypothetical protein
VCRHAVRIQRSRDFPKRITSGVGFEDAPHKRCFHLIDAHQRARALRVRRLGSGTVRYP